MLAGYVFHIPSQQSTKDSLDDVGFHVHVQLDSQFSCWKGEIKRI